MKTHIVLIVDRSGSMYSLKNDAEGGVNTFISEQQAIPDSKAFLYLAQFDNEYGVVYDGLLAKAPKYTLVPRGSTALLDAIGKTLADIQARAKKKDKVIVNIITDGHENSSVDWNKTRLNEQMEACKKLGWQFEFMVADASAMDDAYSYGFAASSVHTYALSGSGVRSAHSNLSASTAMYRSESDSGKSMDPNLVVPSTTDGQKNISGKA